MRHVCFSDAEGYLGDQVVVHKCLAAVLAVNASESSRGQATWWCIPKCAVSGGPHSHANGAVRTRALLVATAPGLTDTSFDKVLRGKLDTWLSESSPLSSAAVCAAQCASQGRPSTTYVNCGTVICGVHAECAEVHGCTCEDAQGRVQPAALLLLHGPRRAPCTRQHGVWVPRVGPHAPKLPAPQHTLPQLLAVNATPCCITVLQLDTGRVVFQNPLSEAYYGCLLDGQPPHHTRRGDCGQALLPQLAGPALLWSLVQGAASQVQAQGTNVRDSAAFKETAQPALEVQELLQHMLCAVTAGQAFEVVVRVPCCMRGRLRTDLPPQLRTREQGGWLGAERGPCEAAADARPSAAASGRLRGSSAAINRALLDALLTSHEQALGSTTPTTELDTGQGTRDTGQELLQQLLLPGPGRPRLLSVAAAARPDPPKRSASNSDHGAAQPPPQLRNGNAGGLVTSVRSRRSWVGSTSAGGAPSSAQASSGGATPPHAAGAHPVGAAPSLAGEGKACARVQVWRAGDLEDELLQGGTPGALAHGQGCGQGSTTATTTTASQPGTCTCPEYVHHHALSPTELLAHADAASAPVRRAAAGRHSLDLPAPRAPLLPPPHVARRAGSMPSLACLLPRHPYPGQPRAASSALERLLLAHGQRRQLHRTSSGVTQTSCALGIYTQAADSCGSNACAPEPAAPSDVSSCTALNLLPVTDLGAAASPNKHMPASPTAAPGAEAGAAASTPLGGRDQAACASPERVAPPGRRGVDGWPAGPWDEGQPPAAVHAAPGPLQVLPPTQRGTAAPGAAQPFPDDAQQGASASGSQLHEPAEQQPTSSALLLPNAASLGLLPHPYTARGHVRPSRASDVLPTIPDEEPMGRTSSLEERDHRNRRLSTRGGAAGGTPAPAASGLGLAGAAAAAGGGQPPGCEPAHVSSACATGPPASPRAGGTAARGEPAAGVLRGPWPCSTCPPVDKATAGFGSVVLLPKVERGSGSGEHRDGPYTFMAGDGAHGCTAGAEHPGDDDCTREVVRDLLGGNVDEGVGVGESSEPGEWSMNGSRRRMQGHGGVQAPGGTPERAGRSLSPPSDARAPGSAAAAPQPAAPVPEASAAVRPAAGVRQLGLGFRNSLRALLSRTALSRSASASARTGCSTAAPSGAGAAGGADVYGGTACAPRAASTGSARLAAPRSPGGAGTTPRCPISSATGAHASGSGARAGCAQGHVQPWWAAAGSAGQPMPAPAEVDASWGVQSARAVSAGTSGRGVGSAEAQPAPAAAAAPAGHAKGAAHRASSFTAAVWTRAAAPGQPSASSSTHPAAPPPALHVASRLSSRFGRELFGGLSSIEVTPPAAAHSGLGRPLASLNGEFKEQHDPVLATSPCNLQSPVGPLSLLSPSVPSTRVRTGSQQRSQSSASRRRMTLNTADRLNLLFSSMEQMEQEQRQQEVLRRLERPLAAARGAAGGRQRALLQEDDPGGSGAPSAAVSVPTNVVGVLREASGGSSSRGAPRGEWLEAGGGQLGQGRAGSGGGTAGGPRQVLSQDAQRAGLQQSPHPHSTGPGSAVMGTASAPSVLAGVGLAQYGVAAEAEARQPVPPSPAAAPLRAAVVQQQLPQQADSAPPPYLWHRVHISPARGLGQGAGVAGGGAAGTDGDEHSGGCAGRGAAVEGPLTLTVTQIDVTQQVEAQARLGKLLEQEHKVLESIYPRHVIEYMTLVQGAQSQGPGGGSSPAPCLFALGPGTAGKIASLATSHPCVTIMFCDIVGFTDMSSACTPLAVMGFLNELYRRFDALVDIYKVYKVETIGDCYMVAGGLVAYDEDGYKSVISGREDPLHAVRVMEFAKAMLRAARDVRMPHTGEAVQLRVGLHSGPVTSGVVGDRMPRFCLFGDTVNVASRMESTCRPGCVHVSAATHGRLPSEAWRDCGMTAVKGKGAMRTFEWAGDVDELLDGRQLSRVVGLYL